jgi:hypothetical protein
MAQVQRPRRGDPDRAVRSFGWGGNALAAHGSGLQPRFDWSTTVAHRRAAHRLAGIVRPVAMVCSHSCLIDERTCQRFWSGVDARDPWLARSDSTAFDYRIRIALQLRQ